MTTYGTLKSQDNNKQRQTWVRFGSRCVESDSKSGEKDVYLDYIQISVG